MRDNDTKNISHHILPTSSNLLGLCFLLVSFIKVMKLPNKTLIDSLTGLAVLFFLFSSIFSYASMRTQKKPVIYENIADIIFLIGLGFLSIISLTVIFEVIH